MRLAGTIPNSHAERRLVRRFSFVRISRSPQILAFRISHWPERSFSAGIAVLAMSKDDGPVFFGAFFFFGAAFFGRGCGVGHGEIEFCRLGKKYIARAECFAVGGVSDPWQTWRVRTSNPARPC